MLMQSGQHGASGHMYSLNMHTQDLGDPSKQPAWARLQHELPPAVIAWATAAEQMVAATSAFLVCTSAPCPAAQLCSLPCLCCYSCVLFADHYTKSAIAVAYLLQASSLQCHSQQQAAVEQYDAAVHSAASTAELASWAEVDTWQDAQRRQQDGAGSDRSAMPAEDERTLCTVQLQVLKQPADSGQVVQLVLTVLDAGNPVEDAAAALPGHGAYMAAQLQLRLTSREVEAIERIDSAAEELAVVIDKLAAVQRRLLNEHLAAVSEC